MSNEEGLRERDVRDGEDEYNDDEDDIEERDRRRDREIEEIYNSVRATSTPIGARSKVSNPYQILLEQNRIEVKNNFPEMKSDVIIRQMEGKIQLSIFGSDEWTNLRKPDGKINSFRGELKKALGQSMKSLEKEYFIRLKKIRPKLNEKDFELIYEKGGFRVRLHGNKTNGVFLFKKDGIPKITIGKALREKLGPLASELVDENENKNEVDQTKIKDIDNELENPDLDDDQRDNLEKEKARLNETIYEREKINEKVKGEMTLTEQIKAIFKKRGMTITSVVSVAIAIISAIVSNLGIGLTKLAKNLGSGLKEIGKKLATLLPGMVGAIASFIFKTAGEAIGFLSKHAWLLIIAVVIAVVDRFKKKNK